MSEKSRIFRLLHASPEAFVIPNPWDAGTARLLEAMGSRALATTSDGLAFSLGLPEGQVPWQKTLQNCQTLFAATSLPGEIFSVAELSRAGAKGISVGGSMARLAYGSLVKAAREVSENGTFAYSKEAIGFT